MAARLLGHGAPEDASLSTVCPHSTLCRGLHWTSLRHTFNDCCVHRWHLLLLFPSLCVSPSVLLHPLR